MINSIFENKFNRETFTEFIQDIIPSLSLDERKQETRKGFKSIQQIAEVADNRLDLVVFIANPDSSLHARVEITKDTYAVLKNHARSNALVAYISDDSSDWRLSLITTKVTRTKDGTKESISNPRRFSYVLGPNAKVATPSKMLQGTIGSIIDLENKFSLAVVSKEFFTQIATQYSKLVGGTRGEGRTATVFERTLNIGATNDAVNANFAIRLIGRLVFCWFLKQKKGHVNDPLIPSEILSVSAVKTISDYYHSVCVPLFFEVLNKPQNSRPTFFSHSEFFDKVPFLNGGLFQDHAEDNHKFNRTTGMSERRGVVYVPDLWFTELFQIFEEYNFTIDENTSIDTELSIDPEMLGRIFENLLAEVNPETGASARKSTGSFYTPREIVDFMVEESLIAHLKTKTNIPEEKLRALSSYDLDDDASNPVDQQERKLLVEVIHNTTVLDPACGSGAFPIGVLQRLVHMLGVLDPECSIYLNKLPPEVRRQLQKHSLTYVRKLGIIRECIHGVDIQPIAIDISRLRCFLTLVVDQQVDDNAPNRGIEPLPNLDFKFVCANTLIKPPVFDSPLFGDEFADELGELIDEYFAPIDQLHKLETARKLQQLISDKTKEELESILKSYSHVKDEKYKKALAQKNEKSDTERLRINNLWGSYENIFQNKPVGFFDTRYFFPTVSRDGGFDIVIGNPPYIKEYTDKRVFDGLRDSPYYQGKTDLWSMFTAISIDYLKNNCTLGFIGPNNWATNAGSSILRNKIIKETQIVDYIDFGDFKVFEQAGIQTMILILNKTKPQERYSVNYLKIIDKNESAVVVYEKMFGSKTKIELIADSIINKNLTFSTSELSTVLNKLKKQGNFVLNEQEIAQGIVAAPDKCFLEKDLSVYSLEESKYLKKYFTATGRYQSANSKNYIFYISDKNFNDKNIDDFPNIKIHFEPYKTILQDAKKKYGTPDKPYFYLHRERDEKFFETGPKIVCGVRVMEPSFFYTEDKYYGSRALNFIKTERVNLKYLVGILNSKVSFFWLKNRGKQLGDLMQVDKGPLLEIPLFVGSKDQQEQVIKIVDKILTVTESADYSKNPTKMEEVKEYEKQIDQLVNNLYDLTPEEIEIIEKN